VELASPAGQPVLEPLRPLAVPHPAQDARLDEPVQAVGQHVAGDAEALLELAEPPDPEEDVADDQQRPPLPDELERPGDRAVLPFVVAPQHTPTLAPLHDATRTSGCVKLLGMAAG